MDEGTLRDLLVEGGDDTLFWLSGGRGPTAVRPASGTAVRADVGLAADARVLGYIGGRLVVLVGDVVLAIDPDSTAPDTLLGGVETALLAPEHGLLIQSIRRGEIVISPLPDLTPAWGWADVGAATSAIAISPEGDRVYQAVDGIDEGPGARVLVRDRLSGRTLGEIQVDAPYVGLAVTAAGDLVGISWDGERSNAAVERLVWEEGVLRRAWTTYIPAPMSARAARLAVTSDGGRIAVAGGDEKAGLTLLDGETGFIIADFDGTTRDAVFDGQGRLYAVTDSAVLTFRP